MHPIEPVGIGPGLGAGQLPPDLRLTSAGAGKVGALVQQRQGLQQRQTTAAGGGIVQIWWCSCWLQSGVRRTTA